jgi:hypothetical protein
MIKEPQLRAKKLFVSGGCWWGSHPASIVIGPCKYVDSTNSFELAEGNRLNSAIDLLESMMYAELISRRVRVLFYIRRVTLVFCGTQIETNRNGVGDVTSALFTAWSRCEMAMWMTLFR